MTYDLTKFDLGDMLKCSLRLREAAAGAPTLEISAQRVCRFLYDELRGPDGERACALVRCYKTHAYGDLDPDLQSFARNQLGAETPRSTMKCLTLMATAGQRPDWNSRHFSRDHRAVPLPSREIVEKAPMISQLIKELGVELKAVLQPMPDVVKDLEGKRHGIFYVQDALGSPYIPAQEAFVIRHGIKSVVGFGGMMTLGDLFAVILFATVPVPPKSAERFRTLALDVKSAFLKFNDTSIFNQTELATSGSVR